MPAAVSDGQIKAPEAPLYEQLLGLPARQRPAHDGGLYRSAQESTRVPKILCLLYFQELSVIVGCWEKEYARSVRGENGGGGAAGSFGGSFVS